jgi:transcriptional regulator with XRE-family HTH domain
MAGEFGMVLRKLRRDAKLTLRELANDTGISREQLGKYELGEYIPKSENLARLSRVFKADVNMLTKMSNQARKAHKLGKTIEPQKFLESLRKIDKNPDYPGNGLSLNDLKRKLMITDTNLADVINQIRKKYRLSMAELSKILGVSSSLICRVEGGERRLSRQALLNLYRIVNSDTNKEDKHTQNSIPLSAKSPEEVYHDADAALPLSIPVYESLKNRTAKDHVFIDNRYASIWGTNIAGVIASGDLCYVNTIIEGDLLVVSMDNQPKAGDLCIVTDYRGEYIDKYTNRKNADYRVILQIIRTICTG